MFVLFEITAVESFLIGIPESLGLLAFGLGLTTTAVLIRWLLGRADTTKSEKELEKKLTR